MVEINSSVFLKSSIKSNFHYAISCDLWQAASILENSRLAADESQNWGLIENLDNLKAGCQGN